MAAEACSNESAPAVAGFIHVPPEQERGQHGCLSPVDSRSRFDRVEDSVRVAAVPAVGVAKASAGSLGAGDGYSGGH